MTIPKDFEKDIFCTADIHNQVHTFFDNWGDEIGSDDIVIIAGDLTHGIDHKCDMSTLKAFKERLKHCPAQHVILIGGNHDEIFKKFGPSWVKKFFSKNTSVTYLQDEMVTINGVHIYGSPWTPKVKSRNGYIDWNFDPIRGTEKLEKAWRDIPSYTDVLVTHGPPKGILDHVPGSGPVGDEMLLERVSEVQPDYHIFGHIHEQHQVVEKKDTTFVNCSFMNSPVKNDPPIRLKL